MVRLRRFAASRQLQFGLPRRRRLVIVVLSILFAIFAVHSLVTYLLDDPRFYDRVDLFIPPASPDELGIRSDRVNDDKVIPHKLWQIFLSPPDVETPPEIPKEQTSWAKRWRKTNPRHAYNLVRDTDARALIGKYVTPGSHLHRVLAGPGSLAMKSDLLRYLLLFVEGGVYTDLDTIPVWPIETWVVPEEWRSRVNVIIGMEFDSRGGESWPQVHHDLQFCQWTIAAAPGHSLFTNVITRALTFLEDLTDDRGIDFADLRPSTNDVLTTTGPAMWTDAVLQQLRAIDPSIQSLHEFSGMKEDRLIGDILVLSIDGFGMGQRHSGSTRGSTPAAARMKHKFRGTWKHLEDPG